MKKIYICGDSFGCPDLGWEFDPWPVQLQSKLGDSYQVINLSLSCASNVLIRVQIDKAIKEQADYVILLATTSTRYQGKVNDASGKFQDIYDRFKRIGQQDIDDDDRDLACYSIYSLNDSCVFEKDDIRVLKEYHSRLFDLDLEILNNQYVIESSLYTLRENTIPFIFDQGGFENPIFGYVKNQCYFKNFENQRSDINQWTVSDLVPKSTMAHKHITDQEIHTMTAEYYCQNIVDFFQKK